MATWDTFGGVEEVMLSLESVCSSAVTKQGELMLFPSRLSWQGGCDMCRRWVSRTVSESLAFLYTGSLCVYCRFGGRLHIDMASQADELESITIVHKGNHYTSTVILIISR